MANIKISELNAAGSELFNDSESFLNELTDVTSMSVYGGNGGYGGSQITSKAASFLTNIVGAFANLAALDFVYKLASKFDVK